MRHVLDVYGGPPCSKGADPLLWWGEDLRLWTICTRIPVVKNAVQYTCISIPPVRLRTDQRERHTYERGMSDTCIRLPPNHTVLQQRDHKIEVPKCGQAGNSSVSEAYPGPMRLTPG